MDVINIGAEENNKMVKVGAYLNDEIKERLVELLCEYTNMFSWSYQDIPELDTKIIMHKLPLKQECPPIK